jgi:uncharacterized protein (TIGR02996 family)
MPKKKPRRVFTSPASVLPGEADILASVLANLADDHARLVYADWLEEHDDPRGPLLRAFTTAYRAGKKLPALDSAPKPWRAVVGLTLMAQIRETTLAPLSDTVLALARPALAFAYERAPERGIPVGASKFGGRPDVPEGAWPEHEGEPLTFLAQFNLADLHASPVARPLPATGLLSLFCLYDYGEDFEEGNWRLLYFPDTAELSRREQHPDLPEEHLARSGRLMFTEVPSLPDEDSLWAKQLMRAVRKVDPKGVDYSNLRDGMGADGLLGHPHTFEGDVLGKKSVRHLLTVGDNSATGWWPDGNMMYITIPEADLKHARFERAKATLQCF